MGGRPWAPTEDAWLKRTYGLRPTLRVAAFLGRTLGAAQCRASRLGLRAPHRVWSPEKVGYLRTHYGKLPSGVLAKRLGLSLSSIHSKAMKLRITRPQRTRARPRPWTAAEDATLKSGYGEIRTSQIALSLGRTRGSVYHRIDRLGLASKMGTPEFLRRQALPRTAQPFTKSEDPAVLGYVAGIIDGEGAIVRAPHLCLSVSTTTHELALALQQMVGGSVAGPYLYGRTKVFGTSRCKLKPQYHWNFSAKYHVYLLLKALRPFLIVKSKEASEAIAYFERRYRWGTE